MKYIQIFGNRYNLDNIDKYYPSGSLGINLVLNSGKITSEKFKTESQRDEVLNAIDQIAGLKFEADEIVTKQVME